jgi:hypothetical protein
MKIQTYDNHVIETVRALETSVCFNETTRRYIPVDCHVHMTIIITYYLLSTDHELIPAGCKRPL